MVNNKIKPHKDKPVVLKLEKDSDEKDEESFRKAVKDKLASFFELVKKIFFLNHLKIKIIN